MPRLKKQNIQNDSLPTAIHTTTTGAIVEQIEITEVTKLEGNLIASKSPLRVPEALDLVLETLSDGDKADA